MSHEQKRKGRMKKQQPLILESPLTGEIYFVSKYINEGNGNFISLNKRKATSEEIAEYKSKIKKERKNETK
jgi:hypothetical protein